MVLDKGLVWLLFFLYVLSEFCAGIRDLHSFQRPVAIVKSPLECLFVKIWSHVWDCTPQHPYFCFPRKCLKLPRNFALSVNVWFTMNTSSTKAGLPLWLTWMTAPCRIRSCSGNLTLHTQITNRTLRKSNWNSQSKCRPQEHLILCCAS